MEGISERMAARLGKPSSIGGVDPRLLEEMLQSPAVAPRIPTQVREKMGERIVTRKWTKPQRSVYGAVRGGETTEEGIARQTGLDPERIKRAIASLSRGGFIKITKPPKPKPIWERVGITEEQWDVYRAVKEEGLRTKAAIAEATGLGMSVVEKAVKVLREKGFLKVT